MKRLMATHCVNVPRPENRLARVPTSPVKRFQHETTSYLCPANPM